MTGFLFSSTHWNIHSVNSSSDSYSGGDRQVSSDGYKESIGLCSLDCLSSFSCDCLSYIGAVLTVSWDIAWFNFCFFFSALAIFPGHCLLISSQALKHIEQFFPACLSCVSIIHFVFSYKLRFMSCYPSAPIHRYMITDYCSIRAITKRANTIRSQRVQSPLLIIQNLGHQGVSLFKITVPTNTHNNTTGR